MRRNSYISMACLIALLGACSPKSPGDSGATEPTSAALISDGSQECSSPATYATIKEIVFDKAVEVAGGNPVPINDLRTASSTRMDLPLVKGYNKDLRRAECSGRFVMSVPATARAAFLGKPELKADLVYSVQPSADGQGDVVEVQGLEYVVQDIVAANALRDARRLEDEGGPHLANTFNPSFNCGPRLTNTERMICQDEDLSRKDRQLSSAFKIKLANSLDRQTLLAWQRSALAERTACADSSCLNQWYDNMLAEY